MNAFSDLNPFVSAVYFVSVAAGAMFSESPFVKLIALVCGVACCLRLEKRVKPSALAFWVLAFAVIAISNPLFSHNGVTVLFFVNSNPITLEALLCGVDIAVMLVATVFWFRCFNAVFTEEKLLYLLGGVSPRLALLISSALRFVPLLKQKYQRIVSAQKTMGMFASDSWLDKLKSALRAFSALVTDVLENAVDIGASMKARGFGLSGRSRFSLFSFRKSDLAVLALVLALDAVFAFESASGALEFEFYPAVSFAPIGADSTLGMASFGVLCLLPFIKEGMQWIFWKLKI